MPGSSSQNHSLMLQKVTRLFLLSGTLDFGLKYPVPSHRLYEDAECLNASFPWPLPSPHVTISCYQTPLGQNYNSPQFKLTGELKKGEAAFRLHTQSSADYFAVLELHYLWVL